MRQNVRPLELIEKLRRLVGLASRPPVADAAALADFLAEETAYVAQRTVLEYCRARTGLNWDKLFQEAPFLASFEVCRWDAYGLMLGDVAELALIQLRRADLAEPASLVPGLLAACRGALLRHPVPAHQASWDQALDRIAEHLARVLLAEPHPVHLVGIASANQVFDWLPIHPDLRRHDRDMFRNSVRFALLRVHDDMTRRFDRPALAAALAAVPPGG
jgi:hypothetical protein